MTDSLEAIRAETAELRDVIATANARREQIPPLIAELNEELERLARDVELATDRVQALQRAEAVLVEHSAPEPAAPDPKPRERLPLPELMVVTEAGDGQPRRHLRDPLRVIPREAHSGFRSSRPSPRFIADGGYPGLDTDNLSPTDVERAELALEILDGGEAAQCDVADAMQDVMGIENHGTAQKITSRALAILYKQGRIVDTGEKAIGHGGKRTSPIWRVKS